MKKMMFLSKNWYFSVQKALIYYTVNKSHHNSFILLVFSHVVNFRYVVNFRFLTLYCLLMLNRSHFLEINSKDLKPTNIWNKGVQFLQFFFFFFFGGGSLQLYLWTVKMAVVKFCHSITVKYS